MVSDYEDQESCIPGLDNIAIWPCTYEIKWCEAVTLSKKLDGANGAVELFLSGSSFLLRITASHKFTLYVYSQIVLLSSLICHSSGLCWAESS